MYVFETLVIITQKTRISAKYLFIPKPGSLLMYL